MLFFFGRRARLWRSLTIPVPRECCPWCTTRNDLLYEQVQTLETKTAGLEKRLEIVEALTPLTVNVDASPFVFVYQVVDMDQGGQQRTIYGIRPS